MVNKPHKDMVDKLKYLKDMDKYKLLDEVAVLVIALTVMFDCSSEGLGLKSILISIFKTRLHNEPIS